jgi:hypothetical protein
MKLPLSNASTTVLLQLLRGLDELGCHSVLVGGLVPPLLFEALEPDPLDQPPRNRGTTDCDVAIDVAVTGFAKWSEAQGLLTQLGLKKDPKRTNQFRWVHGCGLLIDPMPVPAGIERGDLVARTFALTVVEGDTSLFYRGYELALQQPMVVIIELEDGSQHSLRIAGLASLLVMKLQAWIDSLYAREKDAQDVGWLLRHLPAETVVRQLVAARALRAELIAEAVERLRSHFADPDARGVCHYTRQAYRGIADDYTERHRNALTTAVNEILRLYAAT